MSLAGGPPTPSQPKRRITVVGQEAQEFAVRRAFDGHGLWFDDIRITRNGEVGSWPSDNVVAASYTEGNMLAERWHRNYAKREEQEARNNSPMRK